MTSRTTLYGLQVATVLQQFVDEQVLPGTGIRPAAFWKGFSEIVHTLVPKNAEIGRAHV